MSSRRSPSAIDDAAGRLQVEAPGGRRRPFMRGIMIHALTERGVAFEDAFRAANKVRAALRGRDVVTREELAERLRELLGDEPFGEERAVAQLPFISVSGAGEAQPFSKGVLAQSLLAAALEPNQAFEVALQIERALLARGQFEIDRDALRRLTRATLEEELGPQAAEHYLIWRQHEESNRPLLLLLGGAAGVGKSSLALEVAHRLGIGRVFSTDSIRQIMRIMLSPELVPALHASSFDAWKRLGIREPTDDDVVEAFRMQAGTVSVGVRGSLDRAVSENESLVLDGVSIVPGMIDLDGYRVHADVVFLVVAILDDDTFKARFAGRSGLREPHRYVAHFDSIQRVQEHLLEVADEHDVPIVDNTSLDRAAASVVRHVLEALRQSGKPDALAVR